MAIHQVVAKVVDNPPIPYPASKNPLLPATWSMSNAIPIPKTTRLSPQFAWQNHTHFISNVAPVLNHSAFEQTNRVAPKPKPALLNGFDDPIIILVSATAPTWDQNTIPALPRFKSRNPASIPNEPMTWAAANPSLAYARWQSTLQTNWPPFTLEKRQQLKFTETPQITPIVPQASPDLWAPSPIYPVQLQKKRSLSAAPDVHIFSRGTLSPDFWTSAMTNPVFVKRFISRPSEDSFFPALVTSSPSPDFWLASPTYPVQAEKKMLRMPVPLHDLFIHSLFSPLSWDASPIYPVQMEKKNKHLENIVTDVFIWKPTPAQLWLAMSQRMEQIAPRKPFEHMAIYLQHLNAFLFFPPNLANLPDGLVATIQAYLNKRTMVVG
jgi:hypothetical protein